MNYIKKIFLSIFSSYKIIEEEIKKSRFEIEYYPITDRYYPKYRGFYMAKNYHTGIMELKDEFLFIYADFGKTEEEAKKLIELFKEQRLKENVKTINLSD